MSAIRTPPGPARADSLADHVRRVVDKLPPLTETQRARLAALLRPGEPDNDEARATTPALATTSTPIRNGATRHDATGQQRDG